jgi:hypothetical protein
MKRKPKPSITHDELASTTFEPIPEFVGLSPEAKETHEARLQDISIVSRMAIHLLGLPKEEVVQKLRKRAEADGAAAPDEMLGTLAHGRELTQRLVRMLEAAEARFAVALANVIDQDGVVRRTTH